MAKGPYETLYIYELQGVLELIPRSWREGGFLGHWIDSGYSFAFFSCPARELVEKEIRRFKEIILRSETVLPYEDWEAGAPLRALQIGPLKIAPPWEVQPQDKPDKTLVIDPGVSFGSGLHPSTRLCLELILELFKYARPKSVLDLGTGSGILALASLRLGALRALGVDNQPVSVERALSNARMNGLEANFRVELGDALVWAEYPAELVMANLDLALLKKLVIHPSLEGKRWLILSGILEGQWQTLAGCFSQKEWEVLKKISLGSWVGVLLRNTRH